MTAWLLIEWPTFYITMSRQRSRPKGDEKPFLDHTQRETAVNMNILGLVAARAGSKGVPGKNLRTLDGQPLIAHTLMTLKGLSSIDRLILSTEDATIADIGKQYGGEVPFLRSKELASDTATALEVAKHAMESMDDLGFRADIIVHVFPTSPFLKGASIERAIKLVKDGFDSAIGVCDCGHAHPFRMLTLDDTLRIHQYVDDPAATRPVNRQDMPSLFIRAGGLYVRNRTTLEQWDGRDFALGEKCAGVEIDEVEAVDINTELDFKFAEFLAELQPKSSTSRLR